MEKIYSDEQVCKLAKASEETVQFLLAFSKSLHVSEYKNVTFESFLN